MDFRGVNFWMGKVSFLLGVLPKTAFWLWFLGGETVVDCAVNVVF
jgi:hypothetical protein